MRRVVLPSLILLLFAAPGNGQTVEQHAELHAYLRERVDAARAREQRAAVSAEHANALVQSATNQSDTAAIAMAREAVSAAERALRNARRLRERTEADLWQFEAGVRRAVATNQPVGYLVLQRQGEIRMRSSDGETVYDGRTLKVGDEITSGPNSSMTVILPDGSQLQMGPNSSVIYEGERRGYVLGKGVFRDLVRCAVARLKGDYCVQRLILRPAFCVSVRGTEYVVQVVDSTTARIEALEGQVDIVGADDVVVASVTRGQRVVIQKRGASVIVTPDSARLERWWLESSGGV